MHSTDVTLVLGGARAGKSTFAEELTQAWDRRVYIATAVFTDDEMAQRIAAHRTRRGPDWRTVEEPVELAASILRESAAGKGLLVDCLTVWIGNLMHHGRDVDAAQEALLESLAAAAGPVVLVANEVGLGIVPDNAMARTFRDHAGRLNQAVARVASRVYFVAAGIPMTQGGGPGTMTARALMFQGTASDAGKSLVTAGLCRLLARRGYAVRPFKPQNMSNNAAVTPDGGEIGRAQALQARACGVPPSVDMNPVLLKPQSDVGAQVVVHGKVRGNFDAGHFQDVKQELMPAVLESFERLKANADFVLVEGAGSAAEVNLRAHDIANMGFAAAGVPVVLVADIDRGGVIANLVGTWELLPDEERGLLRGYLINRFRGDVRLFADGLRTITTRTGLPSFGIIPYLAAALRLPEEDALSLDNRRTPPGGGDFRIALPRVPHIANFDDFDPLMAEPAVRLDMVPPGHPLPGDAGLIILPGSKATVADLRAFKSEGWDIDLMAHRRRGGAILGICAGYQMLGRTVADPQGIEGPPGEEAGLGLLDHETVLTAGKTLRQVAGVGKTIDAPFTGYEMPVGETTRRGAHRPFLLPDGHGHDPGTVSEDGRLMGCYVHGLLTGDAFRREFLRSLGVTGAFGPAYEAAVDEALDAVADAFEEAIDIDRLLATAA